MLSLWVKAQVYVEQTKSAITKSVRSLADDDSGASLLEYSVLIGLILALSIALIVFAGQWANAQWSALSTALTGNGAAIAT